MTPCVVIDLSHNWFRQLLVQYQLRPIPMSTYIGNWINKTNLRTGIEFSLTKIHLNISSAKFRPYLIFDFTQFDVCLSSNLNRPKTVTYWLNHKNDIKSACILHRIYSNRNVLLMNSFKWDCYTIVAAIEARTLCIVVLCTVLDTMAWKALNNMKHGCIVFRCFCFVLYLSQYQYHWYTFL